MKHLVIYVHPNPQSFCHAILETVKESLVTKKHDFVVRDLYSLEFDPVLKAAVVSKHRSIGKIKLRDQANEQECLGKVTLLGSTCTDDVSRGLDTTRRIRL